MSGRAAASPLHRVPIGSELIVKPLLEARQVHEDDKWCVCVTETPSSTLPLPPPSHPLLRRCDAIACGGEQWPRQLVQLLIKSRLNRISRRRPVLAPCTRRAKGQSGSALYYCLPTQKSISRITTEDCTLSVAFGRGGCLRALRLNADVNLADNEALPIIQCMCYG